jgi:hypothetical protein
MRFLDAILWGFLQNAPVIMLLAAAVWYWAQKKKACSITCALGGAVAGPLLVHFTELVTGGHHEPLTVTLVNIVSLSLLQVLLVAYLGTEANWSNWRVDLGLGSLAGVSLAVAQGFTSQGARLVAAVLPSMVLAVGGTLALVGIRKLKGRTLALALASAALLAAVMTLLINAVDGRSWTQG